MITLKDHLEVVNEVLDSFIILALSLIYLIFVLDPVWFIETLKLGYSSVVAFISIPTYWF